MSEEIVKIGIIGIGNMGSSHAQRIANGDIQGMKLVAVADRKEKRRAWAKESLPEDYLFGWGCFNYYCFEI